jgi:hypothetical protein
MLSESDYRRLVVRLVKSPSRKRQGKLFWRESLGTLLLGTLSASLGISALAALALRNPSLDLLLIASFDLFLIAFVGQWLGIGGIFVSRRIGRGITPLPVLGTVLCLIPLVPVYLFLLLSLVVILSPLALLIWGVRDMMQEWKEYGSIPPFVSKTIRWFEKRNSINTSQSA